MKTKVRKASAIVAGAQVCPSLNRSKKACHHLGINNEVAELMTSSTPKCRFVCISSSRLMPGHESFGGKRDKNADHTREAADDACQDLRPTFSSIDLPSIDQKVHMQAAHPSAAETLFSPVLHVPKVEASKNCCGTDDDWRDADEKIDMLGSRQDGNSTAWEDNSMTMTTSAAYPTSDVFRDASMTRFSTDTTMTVQDILRNTESSNEDEFIGSQTTFDVTESCIIWPLVDDNPAADHRHETVSVEEALLNSDGACLFFAIQQTKSLEYGDTDKDANDSGIADEVDDFDPYLFIKSLPDLSEVVSPYRPGLLPRQTRRRQPFTLVLDLDETLVHSTLEHCDDADFTFPVRFNLKEHTVYVRRRPYLQLFMEKVAQMFEIIVFTASQSIYAEQLLNKLDPKQKLIRHRVYRESCMFVDGNYMKDLTVLGRDLAKVAIIDNSPQAFRFQIDNGIPIESWFDDRSDCALVSLLPFLETLVGVDDVRPIIAKKFNLRQTLAAIDIERPSLERREDFV